MIHTGPIARFLHDQLRYPFEWLDERSSPLESDGIVLKNQFGEPFLVCVLDSQRGLEYAEAALKSTMLGLPFAGCGLATDADSFRFVRRRFVDDKFDFLTALEPFNLSPSAPLNLLRNLKADGELGRGRALVPLTERLESVFFEMHSHMRDIDGLHADEALDELCKLLYAKLFDEERTKVGDVYSLQRWIYSSSEEFASAIRSIYTQAGAYDSRVFSLKIPGYKRSRGVFSGPIRLSSPALVRAMETLESYSISLSSLDVKGRAFQQVLGPAVRAGMGQFFTPDPIVRFMVSVGTPSIDDLILDPFAGSGHFLSASLQVVQSDCDITNKAFHEFAFGKLHGIEKSDRMVRVAMTDMRLHGDGHSNLRCTDALLDFSNYPDIQPESFDLILTNPPFGCLLGQDAMAQLGSFELSAGKKSVPLEILGLERSLQFLRPGGRLLIVLPDGVLANRATGSVRGWIMTKAKLRGIFSLPIETFAPNGANVKTSILVVRKWMPGEATTTDYEVFLGRLDSVGYDARGRKLENSDLAELAIEFRQFIAQEGW
jgi:type I restriction enzyme M protein